MEEEIDRLLMEVQRAKFTERRTEARHAFVRPIVIHVADSEPLNAFSKDLSKQGIGVIADQEFSDGTIAVLKIHSTTQYPVHVKCELRWCDKFGTGWFLTGWKFLSVAAAPH